jgi:hypothetical protein
MLHENSTLSRLPSIHGRLRHMTSRSPFFSRQHLGLLLFFFSFFTMHRFLPQIQSDDSETVPTHQPPNSTSKRNIPVWSPRISSSVSTFLHPSTSISQTPYQLPRSGTHAPYSSLFLSLPTYPHTHLPSYLAQSARAPASPCGRRARWRLGAEAAGWLGADPVQPP